MLPHPRDKSWDMSRVTTVNSAYRDTPRMLRLHPRIALYLNSSHEVQFLVKNDSSAHFQCYVPQSASTCAMMSSSTQIISLWRGFHQVLLWYIGLGEYTEIVICQCNLRQSCSPFAKDLGKKNPFFLLSTQQQKYGLFRFAGSG